MKDELGDESDEQHFKWKRQTSAVFVSRSLWQKAACRALPEARQDQHHSLRADGSRKNVLLQTASAILEDSANWYAFEWDFCASSGVRVQAGDEGAPSELEKCSPLMTLKGLHCGRSSLTVANEDDVY